MSSTTKTVAQLRQSARVLSDEAAVLRREANAVETASAQEARDAEAAKAREYLFVGGPADGQKFTVPSARSSYDVPVYGTVDSMDASLAPDYRYDTTVDVARYGRHDIAVMGGTGLHTVFVYVGK